MYVCMYVGMQAGAPCISYNNITVLTLCSVCSECLPLGHIGSFLTSLLSLCSSLMLHGFCSIVEIHLGI